MTTFILQHLKFHGKQVAITKYITRNLTEIATKIFNSIFNFKKNK